MATLREYFEKDGGDTMRIDHVIPFRTQEGEIILEVPGRLHINFEANALYISFYVPATEIFGGAINGLLNSITGIIDWRNTIAIAAGRPGEHQQLSGEAQFTGRVYIYSEAPVDAAVEEKILDRGQELGFSVKIRSTEWAARRSEWEKPLAFVSHDFRDKQNIAKPLSMALQGLDCPVWYDEFSLKVGDSLRTSIEDGLRECHKCILILTPHFLANGGWAKREYDSIFTRELVERQNVILPVWHEVTPQMVYEYSPILADRKAAVWENGEDGAERVASQLLAAIRR